MDIKITDTEEISNPDLTGIVSMRYRSASSADIDANYTAVETTRTENGVTVPYLDLTALDSDTYVLHSYVTDDGPTTGTKQTIDIVSDTGL